MFFGGDVASNADVRQELRKTVAAKQWLSHAAVQQLAKVTGGTHPIGKG